MTNLNTGQRNGLALGSGILFGLGLGLSQMIDRERVLGFLDVAGNWDPTLLFVLGGAVAVTLLTFRFLLRWPKPIWAERFRLPTKTRVDSRLVVGSAIFGVGWGMGGYCPGPAIASLALGHWNPLVFVLAFLVGSWTYGWMEKRGSTTRALSQGTPMTPQGSPSGHFTPGEGS